MGERRINFGSDASDARYRVEDTGTGANFTVVEDLNGNTVVLQYDQTNLVGGVPLDLSGQDLLGTDIVDGSNINLSDIAGENITVDGVNDELDGPSPRSIFEVNGVTYREHFNTLDGFSKDLEQGSITIGNGIEIQSGASQFDSSIIKTNSFSRELDYSSDIYSQIHFTPNSSAEEARIGVGNAATNLGNGNSIGVRVSGGDLQGYTEDGNSSTTETLISGISTGSQFIIELDFTAGSDVVFRDVETQNQLGTISSTLPTGTDGRLWRAIANNETGTEVDFNFESMRIFNDQS